MVGGNSRLVGWMDGLMNDYSIAIVDAYIARIAIRIMSDTRDEKKERNKDQRCLVSVRKTPKIQELTVRYMIVKLL